MSWKRFFSGGLIRSAAGGFVGIVVTDNRLFALTLGGAGVGRVEEGGSWGDTGFGIALSNRHELCLLDFKDMFFFLVLFG